MAKGLHTELLGVGAGKALGWTQPQMLAVAAAKAKAGFSLDERALGRVAKGRASPQSRTRLLILPISAKVLGLSCESIAREIYWRDTYERLSEEISEGGTPIALEGFLLHLLEINEADDAGSAWNHAMAPYMFADLQWDAMKSDAFAGVLGHSKREIRQSCVVQFKLARDRFSAFAARVRSGAFGLEAEPANLMAARADSLRAVAAEQLFSLALLNQQHDWKLTIDENGPPLSVRQTVELLPAADEVSRFSSILVGFLPGRGWRRRIDNNKAVLSLAIASAVVETGRVEATSISRLKATCNEAVAALRAPCDGERVALHELPTYQSLARAGTHRDGRRADVRRQSIDQPSRGGDPRGIVLRRFSTDPEAVCRPRQCDRFSESASVAGPSLCAVARGSRRDAADRRRGCRPRWHRRYHTDRR